MKIILDIQAQKDIAFFKKTDAFVVKRIKQLLSDISTNPFTGLGKPEPLKENWSGYWSRRITKEHRIVYKVTEGTIKVASCRYHYEK